MILAAVLCAGCTDDHTGNAGDAFIQTPAGDGVILYSKLIRQPGVPDERELRPVRRARVDVRDEDGFLVTSMFTDEQGRFSYPENSGLLQVTVSAFSRGPRVYVGVYSEPESTTPWSYTGELDELSELVIDEPYVVGAFNVIDLALQAGDALTGLVGDEPAPELRVIWNETKYPVCGACLYFSTFRLELTGAPGDIDAHDDAVVLHELGHYLEAAYGVYANPGGFHEVAQKVSANLAWSEGFATWFSGWIRQSQTYLDIQPGGLVYSLDLETLETVSLGVSVPGDPHSQHSEGLVYGLLWDLYDADPNDDDDSIYDPKSIMSAVLDPLAVVDGGPPGPDLVDWLSAWQCTEPSATTDIIALTNALAFPYSPEPIQALCPPE